MNIFQGFAEIFGTSEYISLIFSGLGETLLISVLAAILGLVLGIVDALIKIAYPKNKKALCVPNAICNIYVTIIRGTPVALQLFIMVFAIFAIRGFPLEITAILTFGINSGAYVSENIRAGILSIDKGQTEAGLSLGLTGGQTMRLIVMPQAIKNVIPTIGNELIALLKETSIVSMVGLIDLTYAARIIGAGDKMANYLVPMLVAAAFYLIFVYAIAFIIKLLEKRMRRGER